MTFDHWSNIFLSNYTCNKPNLHVFLQVFHVYFTSQSSLSSQIVSMKCAWVLGRSPMGRTVSEFFDPDLFRDLDLLTHGSEFLINWKPGPRSFHRSTQVLVGTVWLFTSVRDNGPVVSMTSHDTTLSIALIKSRWVPWTSTLAIMARLTFTCNHQVEN